MPDDDDDEDRPPRDLSEWWEQWWDVHEDEVMEQQAIAAMGANQ